MSDLLHVATRKGLFRVERRRKGHWRLISDPPHFLGDEVSQVLPDPHTGRVYAALRLGHYGVKLHRSEDGGETFHEVTPPAYPEKPADAHDPTPWTVQQVWALAAGGPDRPDTLWAGDLPGGLFRSDDAGETWTLNRALWDRPERRHWFGGGYKHPGIHALGVDPRDGDRLTVGISVGGIWQTEDGGESWHLAATGMHAPYMPPELADEPNVQDPHAIAQCAAAPEVFWCQHHSGVYRSTDGGATWEELEDPPPSFYGFPMAVDPTNPDVAWRVPATSDDRRVPVDGRLVVTRTADAGRSWEILSRGLPAEHAYHLVLRHALDVDASGTHLAMGSNIGGLWVSEDAGDSWQLVSNDLPPVNGIWFGTGA